MWDLNSVPSSSKINSKHNTNTNNQQRSKSNHTNQNHQIISEVMNLHQLSKSNGFTTPITVNLKSIKKLELPYIKSRTFLRNKKHPCIIRHKQNQIGTAISTTISTNSHLVAYSTNSTETEL